MEIKRLILSNGDEMSFSGGNFDEWCICYWNKQYKYIERPLDKEYFNRLRKVARKYGKETVYNDFVKIYDMTGAVVEDTVCNEIKDIAKKYNEFSGIVEKDFSIIYFGMVAEENKDGSVLGKRIKRLGVYQSVILGMLSEKAADFSKGKSWKELNEICKFYGF